jgi:ubiquinone/menaquinone biosynthesis C-methylase UbiE
MTSEDRGAVVANHHADHPGFSGISAYLVALTMVLGRSSVGRLAARLAAVEAGQHVVDIGCGPGAATRAAASLGARVTGVDPSTEMLRVARWLTRSKDIVWLDGAAEALPLGDDEADVAWSLATIHHWPDIPGGLAETLRVLKPGGGLVGIERQVRAGAKGLASHGWTPQQAERFAQDCLDAGFETAEVSTHSKGRSKTLAVTANSPD